MNDREFRLLMYVIFLLMGVVSVSLLWGTLAGVLTVSIGGCALTLTVLNNG